jgi:hypothetical protein
MRNKTVAEVEGVESEESLLEKALQEGRGTNVLMTSVMCWSFVIDGMNCVGVPKYLLKFL